MAKVKIAVLASGRGSNFKAIVESIERKECDADCRVLICNNPDAGAVAIAKAHGVQVELIDKKKFTKRSDLDDYIKLILDRYEVGLVVLAGYMLLIKSKKLLEAYRGRIINIHPALLPAFPGDNAQEDAFKYGAKVSGLTIHLVDETLDGGEIVYQEAVDISECKSADDVAAKILVREHKAYSKVIDSFAHGKYEIEGRRARYVPL